MTKELLQRVYISQSLSFCESAENRLCIKQFLLLLRKLTAQKELQLCLDWNKVNARELKPGYQFGQLTIIEKSEERKNGYVVWTCQCSCGKKINLDARTILRGTHMDCGCQSHVPARVKDLTGQRFGRLLVLGPTDQRTKDGSFIWKCLCDCGSQVDVSSKQLTSGTKKSCGCLAHPPLKNWIGKRFGQLTVIAYAGKEEGMHRWLCRCDCGNEAIVGQSMLLNGKTKSCGCLQKKIIKENLKLSEGTSVTILEKRKGHVNSRNTSGTTGVYQNKKTGKWIAQITFQSKTHYLGSYTTREEAIKARQNGEELYHDAFLRDYYASHPAS